MRFEQKNTAEQVKVSYNLFIYVKFIYFLRDTKLTFFFFKNYNHLGTLYKPLLS